MTTTMMRLLLLLSMTNSFTVGFQIQPVSARSAKTALLQSERDFNDMELSRRYALTVSTAAAAAGLLAPLPAMAAFLFGNTQIVESLEQEYADTVNTKGAPEKHLPVMTILASVGSKKRVQVMVPHVMDPEKPHFIEYLWLKDVNSAKVLASKKFKATDASPPTITANVKENTTVKALLFCNLHGLWQGEEMSV